MSYTNVQTRRLPFFLRYCVDLATYRHLAWNLVESDLRARFRRSRLGILWAVIQPLGFALIIATVWGALRAQGNYWSFAAYVFSGMVVWEYFSTVLLVSQDALSRAQGYLKQTRVPFFIFQIRVPLTSMVIMSFGILGLFGFVLAIQEMPAPGLHLLLVPAFMAIALLFAIPLAAIMSVIGTLYRDVKHISGLGVQAMFFLTPVMLPRQSLDSPALSWLQYANPMVPLIDMFRAPVMQGQLWDRTDVLVISAWTAALWLIALLLSAKVGRRIVFAL